MGFLYRRSIVVDFFFIKRSASCVVSLSLTFKTAAAMSYSRQLLSVTGKPSVGNVFLPTNFLLAAFITDENPLRFGHARR